ncbi:hypothetical protein VZT92_017490 [Zoarces viviparus]|uniref:Uncharacterized protein n=1 Tax=Zoarces viviparus TaxID=48416 RepID=A0AAW1ET85_ZOAVI
MLRCSSAVRTGSSLDRPHPGPLVDEDPSDSDSLKQQFFSPQCVCELKLNAADLHSSRFQRRDGFWKNMKTIVMLIQGPVLQEDIVTVPTWTLHRNCFKMRT